MHSPTNHISVIVPVYARSENSLADLNRCLQSLRNNELPAGNSGIEIVVVDDGSPNVPSRAIEAMASQYEAKFVRLDGNVGPGLARNAGVDVASGALLVFIDSDCVAPKEWIEEITRPVSDGHCKATTACYGGPVTSSWLTVFQDDDFAYRQPSIECEVSFLNSCNMAITRPAFESCGGFPAQRVDEDGALGRELAERGMPARFVPHATVKHNYRKGIKQYYKQRAAFARSLVAGMPKMIGQIVMGKKSRGVSSFSIPRTGLALTANVSGIACLGVAVVATAFSYRTAGVFAAVGIGTLVAEALIHGEFLLFIAKRHGPRQALISLIGLYITDSAYLLGSITGLLRPSALEKNADKLSRRQPSDV